MRCNECQALLDQYVEDELLEQTAKSLAAHLTDCRECAGAHGSMRREQEIYAGYLLDVEPPPDLWANLRLELEKEKIVRESRPHLQRWLAIAPGGLRVTPQLATALVLIITGLAIGIIVWRTTFDASRHPAQPTGAGAQPSSEVNRADARPASDHTDRRGAANDNDGKFLTS